MLNLSPNSVLPPSDVPFLSNEKIISIHFAKIAVRLLMGMSIFFFLMLFVPWTQNIQSPGKVTTLYPSQRPQNIQSTIAGRIDKWYVREGDYVKKGDTIAFLTEIKNEYFDPALIDRTREQINAKASSVGSYQQKIKAIDRQINALQQNRILKLEQFKNKIEQTRLKMVGDSMFFAASKVNFEVAQAQFARQQNLYDQGLKSLTELETRKLKLQETQAKLIEAESKYLSAQNEYINAKISFNNIENEFGDKLAKSASDKYAALSDQFDAEEKLAVLENKLSNILIRSTFNYITAPQSGRIATIYIKGLGETVKEQQDIVVIVPDEQLLAVELYIEPIDLPLLDVGTEVRVQFDGWPAIYFSGWPGVSYGTFGAKVVAIDNVISDNNRYRVMVAESELFEKWPKQLRVGAGARGIALLNRVPIWYEIWRQLNGFPPDFYRLDDATTDEKSK
jgi:multidrug resistance efflux pump